MRHLPRYVLVCSLCLAGFAFGAEPRKGFQPLPLNPKPLPEAPVAKKPVTAYLAAAAKGKPATEFKTTAKEIFLLWKGETLQKGEQVRAVWLAEEVGAATPKDHRIDDFSVTAAGPNSEGVMSLAQQPGSHGWPPGKYRVEVFVGDQRQLALAFTLVKP